MSVFPSPDSASATLFERARKVMPGGNSRHTVYTSPYPIYALRGHGARVTDADGVERLDFINNYTSMIHGHAFPPVVDALRKQAGELIAVGAPSQLEVELAELLTSRVPSLEQVRFCNSGSEAVMFAMKAARAHTGRSKIAKIEGCYHGSYDYAEVSQQPKPKLWGEADRPVATATSAGTPQGVLDDMVILPMNDLPAARAIIAANAESLAAVLLDPLPSRLMFAQLTPEFAQGVAEAIRAVGGLLIVDEVYTLRLDMPGRQPWLGVKADIVTMGKIMGGGLPVGAFGGSAEVLSVYDQTLGHAKVGHGGTFNASPMTMAAGLAAMRALDSEAMAHINALGVRLREGLGNILRTLNLGGPVLGAGSLATFLPGGEDIATVRDVARQPQVFQTLSKLHVELLNRGMLINPAIHYVISTPMTEADIDFTLEQTEAGLRAVIAA